MLSGATEASGRSPQRSESRLRGGTADYAVHATAHLNPPSRGASRRRSRLAAWRSRRATPNAESIRTGQGVLPTSANTNVVPSPARRNALKRARLAYDEKATATLRTHQVDLHARTNAGKNPAAAIHLFVAGVPRSGTTCRAHPGKATQRRWEDRSGTLALAVRG